jgi:hypothetical protein
MPYTLRNLGYETVPSDEHSYSTRVTIENEGGEDKCILLRAEEIDTELPIDIEEWPLIVQAVERLLADRAAKTEAVQPVVTKKFLKSIDFTKADAIKVIGGEVEILDEAFAWVFTEQGHEYWYDRQRGAEKLSSSDKALLQSWVDTADYYEKNND